MMKRTLLAFFLSCSVLLAECPISVIANLDKAAMTDVNKQIAYYAYLHRVKREYIAKSYALLTEVRTVGANSQMGLASTFDSMGNIPLIQMGVIESDIIGAYNKVNLELLQRIIYKNIGKEVDEQFKTAK